MIEPVLASLDFHGMPPMSRERGHQKGWVEKSGKRTKTWTGYWYEYVKLESTEKRMQRSKVLGPCAQMTRRAAEEKLHLLIRERASKVPETTASFREMAEWYLKTVKGRVSKQWYSSLRCLFNRQICPRIGNRVAAELKKSEIQQALNDIAADPTSSSKSIVGKCLTHIRAVFNAAIDDEVLERNPALKVSAPPTRRTDQRFLTIKQCHALLHAAQISSTQDYIILRVFMGCGLRPSELFALRADDVMPGELRIDQSVIDYSVKDQTKTEGARASVPLPAALEREIRDYIRDYRIRDYLFPSATGRTPILPENYLDRRLKKLGVLAKLFLRTRLDKSGNKILTSGLNHQILRRTTGTQAQSLGNTKEVQNLLRHTNPNTTLLHYIKTLEPGVAALAEALDAQLAPGKDSRKASR